MSRFHEKYASILSDMAKGKGELTGLEPQPPGLPRYEYQTHQVRVRKGGLLRSGGSDLSDQLLLEIMLGDGWEIAGVQGQEDLVHFYLQRRHEPDCTCGDCRDWRQFRAELVQ